MLTSGGGKSKSKSPPAPQSAKFAEKPAPPEPKRIKLTIDKKNNFTVKNDVVVEKLADFDLEKEEVVEAIEQVFIYFHRNW